MQPNPWRKYLNACLDRDERKSSNIITILHILQKMSVGFMDVFFLSNKWKWLLQFSPLGIFICSFTYFAKLSWDRCHCFLRRGSLGQEFGTIFELPLTMLTSYIRVLGLSSSSAFDSGLQLMHTLWGIRWYFKQFGSCHPCERPESSSDLWL